MRDCYRGFAFRVDALRIHLSTEKALNRTTLREHMAIVERVEAGDFEQAAQCLKAHVQGTIWQYKAKRDRTDAA